MAPPAQTDSIGTPKFSGSGAIVSTSGYILTAAHVVANATSMTVITAQGTKTATVVRVDESNDLAVLKIEVGDEASLRKAIRKLDEIGPIEPTEVKDKELLLANSLIESLAGSFDPGKWESPEKNKTPNKPNSKMPNTTFTKRPELDDRSCVDNSSVIASSSFSHESILP